MNFNGLQMEQYLVENSNGNSDFNSDRKCGLFLVNITRGRAAES
jgi:hypothetical protein